MMCGYEYYQYLRANINGCRECESTEYGTKDSWVIIKCNCCCVAHSREDVFNAILEYNKKISKGLDIDGL